MRGRGEGLGQAFLSAVEAAVRMVARNPQIWPRSTGSFRRCRVPRFPYAVIYLADAEEIFIAAVMHLRRRPDYWRGRTPEGRS